MELDTYDLYHAIYFGLMVHARFNVDKADAIWPKLWLRIKAMPSYTVRVNGRVTIKKQRVMNKRVRAQMRLAKSKVN